jgi:hypothetical protein
VKHYAAIIPKNYLLVHILTVNPKQSTHFTDTFWCMNVYKKARLRSNQAIQDLDAAFERSIIRRVADPEMRIARAENIARNDQ